MEKMSEWRGYNCIDASKGPSDGCETWNLDDFTRLCILPAQRFIGFSEDELSIAEF